MTAAQLLEQVTDQRTFVAFVRALAAEREDAERIERGRPNIYVVDGAHDWKNADIPSYLYACLNYFSEKPFHKPAREPSWRMLADFLYFGKIIE